MANQDTIHSDDFKKDLSNWVIEQAPGGTVSIKDGQMDINDAGGCTVWFKHKLKGPLVIEFTVTMVDEGGKNDRVSDLNCFWMATDPEDPEDLFANKKRGGKFRNYHSLQLYYVGYGANNNTTTRFRRYPGGGARPLLPEHDLKDRRFLHTANKPIRITILSEGQEIEYRRNGETVFKFKDDKPFTEGWFGFRTVRNHMRIDDFKVKQ